jgi:hypothetical protein
VALKTADRSETTDHACDVARQRHRPRRAFAVRLLDEVKTSENLYMLRDCSFLPLLISWTKNAWIRSILLSSEEQFF